MRRGWLWFIILLVVIAVLGALWIWHDGNRPKSGTVAPSITESLPQDRAATNGNTLKDVLARKQQITNLYCEYAIKPDDGNALRGRMWVQDGNLRSEMLDSQGKATSALIRNSARGVGYMFSSGQKEAVKVTDIQPQDEMNPIRSAAAINENTPVLGRETLDGKPCVIVQYQQDEATIRMWLWEEKGIPIREENTYDNDTTVVEYSNFSFEPIPAARFELPAGIKVLDYSGGGGMP